MEYDWSYVKKTTLWQYEELLQKLNAVLTYPVIRNAYDHSMPQAADFARCLFADHDLNAGEFPAPVVASMMRLDAVGIHSWSDLLQRVATRETCLAFIQRNQIGFEEMIDILKYLLRWALPFHTATRELLDPDDPQEMEYYPVFKAHHLMCSFDLLEEGHCRATRTSLAKQMELPLEVVTRIVHRADIARLPYVRRKTILPVCGAGYDTLAKIAAADLKTMETDMESYFAGQGKSWEDFKSVIVLRGLVTGAKALSKLVIS